MAVMLDPNLDMQFNGHVNHFAFDRTVRTDQLRHNVLLSLLRILTHHRRVDKF